MLPHESTSSFFPFPSSYSEPKPVIKGDDEIQFNSAAEVEFDVDVKVKVEDEPDKEKEENVFQPLSTLFNEPNEECTSKNGTIFEPENVEFCRELKQEEEDEDVWMDESEHNLNNNKLFTAPFHPCKISQRDNFQAHLRLRTHKSIKSSNTPLKKKMKFARLCKYKYQCSESGCGYSTNNNYHLKLHGFSRHGKREEDLKILVCALCSYKTPNRTNLRHHINSVHVSVLPFPCDLCSYQACTKKNLQIHVNCVHLKLRPYKCPEAGCDYAAKQDLTFKQHMRKYHAKSQEEIKYIWKSVSSHFNSLAPQGSKSKSPLQSKSKSKSKSDLSTKSTSKIVVCSENVQPQSKSNLTSQVKSCEIIRGLILYQCKNCEFYTVEQKQLAAHLYNQHNLPRVQLQQLNLCNL